MQNQFLGSPAGDVLNYIQRNGATGIRELALGLGVTATAIRQQVVNLLAEGYLVQKSEHAGRGRPRHIYSLTAKGRSAFPQHYDEFSSTLLREILMSEGPQRVQNLLGRLGQRLARQYEQQIVALLPAERAAELTRVLNDKGIMADIQIEQGSIRVNEYTCPYYQLAIEHRGICDMEQDMLSEVIRQPVELVKCTLDGHHGCQFRIENGN